MVFIRYTYTKYCSRILQTQPHNVLTNEVICMKQIIPANGTVLQILGKPKGSEGPCRLMTFCLPLETEDGMLLLNVLTKELLLLSPEEYASGSQSAYLRDHWFLVPEDTNDYEYASTVRWVLQNYRKKNKHDALTAYTILTTTDCNARCFYCYEKGCDKITMDADTAHRVAAYIQQHCAGKKVVLSWFGGEPLLNSSAIDLICEDLKAAGISYESAIISNGYLFDQELRRKAKELWHIKKAQITLDGTEKIYNRSKAYICNDSSPYQTVLSNIDSLLNEGIEVWIRLNISPVNGDDLMNLIDELSSRFRQKEGLTIYSHPLYDLSHGSHNASEQRSKLFDAEKKLENHLLELGLSKVPPLRRTLKLYHCMADSGNCIGVMPDGKLGLCEARASDEYIGHIDSEELDAARIESWQVPGDIYPECSSCFYFPECTSLKKCIRNSECHDHKRLKNRQKLEQSMLYELQQWKAQNQE